LKRKRIFLAIAVATAIVSILILSGCCNLPHATDQTQDTPLDTNQVKETTPDNHHQNTTDITLAQQSGIQQISSIKAREIAVDFVGYGVVHDIQAFTDEGSLIFEVDVRHDATRYVVLLNAESGSVKSLNRHNDEHAAIAVSPYDVITPDVCDSQITHETANEATNAAVTQNERASQTTNETARSSEQQTARAATSTPPPATPQQPPASSSTGERGNSSSSPAISLERAIEIANADLASRGINANYRSNSGLDWERGQRVWELLFSTTGERMPLIEYYINADNGNIVKFEWDD